VVTARAFCGRTMKLAAITAAARPDLMASPKTALCMPSAPRPATAVSQRIGDDKARDRGSAPCSESPLRPSEMVSIAREVGVVAVVKAKRLLAPIRTRPHQSGPKRSNRASESNYPSTWLPLFCE